MPKLLLTDRVIPSLNPPARLAYYDTHTRGLVLRVSGPTSRQDGRGRAWYFVYGQGRTVEWLPLGTYPALSLKAARDRVKVERGRVDQGINPAADRRTPPTPPPTVYTFGEFVPVYVAFQKGRTKEWRNEEQKIARHLLPAWRDRELKSLTREDVQKLLDAVTAKGLTVGVNRIQALISRICTVALDRGLISSHPAARIIKRFPDTPRDRVLTDTELRALWTGLEAQSGAASDAMKLRLLLGQRGGETAGLLWSELDLDAGIWSLPRLRTKNKQPHMIGLPPTALALLIARRMIVTEDELRVFPGLTLMCDAHKALSVIHGGTYEWKDLRRTNATRLGDLGYEDAAIDRIQNRKRYTITAKHYNLAQYVEPIRAALTAWDEALARVLRGQPMKARGRVVAMRSKSQRFS